MSSESYMEDTGAAAYEGQENSNDAMNNDYNEGSEDVGNYNDGDGGNTGYVDSSYTDHNDDTYSSQNQNVRRSGHARPSDQEIQQNKMMQSRSQNWNLQNHHEHKENQDFQAGTNQSMSRSSHARPPQDEIERNKMLQRRGGMPYSSHVRPTDEAMLHEMSVPNPQESRGDRGDRDDQILTTSQTTNQSDKSYLLQYFPGASEVYNYDENDSIISPSDVSMADRKTIKRAISGHWYFFTFGCVSEEVKAKSLSNKLARIKPDLNLTNHLMRTVETKWRK